jgi:acetoin:2,6-dichlorophenolindophenol oxidoreductase subunit alpha
MPPNVWSLYAQMLRCRLFEEATARCWKEGLISGELHLGTGEEGIIAGVVSQLIEGDALALDHRGTAAMLLRGVDPVSLLRELLGRPDGLCRGMGGHMHLFSKDHLAASSGIVGASGPTAAGFALAAQYLRPGAVAVAFFGEGSMNQGMMLEAMNLSAAWELPALFVCKDDDWSITTGSSGMTGGTLTARAAALGLSTYDVDGREVGEVWEAANNALGQLRAGGGPVFLHATCVHFEGHFLGYQLLRLIRDPLREIPSIASPLIRSGFRSGGAGPGERLAGVRDVLTGILSALRDPRQDAMNDPVRKARTLLLSEPERLGELEGAVRDEIDALVTIALQEVPA